jgi:E3 ubiquitin-protein ligase DOA10
MGVVQLGGSSLRKLSRIALVAFMWTLLTPILTAYIWHVFFTYGTMKEAVTVYKRLANPVDFFKDLVIGSFLSALILCLGLSAAAFREFIVNNNDLLNFANDQQGNNENNSDSDSDADSDDMMMLHQANQVRPVMDDFTDEDDDAQQNQDQDQQVPDQAMPLQPAPNAQANAVQDNNREVDFEELVGLAGPISTLFESFIVVLASNTIFLTFAVYIPLLTGKLFFKIQGISSPFNQNDFITINIIHVAVGYVIFSVLALCWIIFASLYSKYLRRTPDTFTRVSVKLIRYVYTFLKIVAMINVNFVISPFYCGLVLNMVSAEFFDKSIQARIDQLKAEILSGFIIHWVLGISFLFQISFLVKTLREVLHPRVLNFLNNPDDPNFSYLREIVRTPIHLQVRRLLMAFASFAVLLFCLVRAPLKLSRNISPSTFPLVISFADPLVQASIDLMLFWILSHVGIENLRPKLYIKLFLQRWLEEVGKILDLTDFLFGEDEQQNQDEMPEQQSPQWSFSIRIVILLFLAWCTLLIVITAFILTPLIIGRTIFGALPITKTLSNDLYLHILGLYAIIGVGYIVHYLVKQAQQHQLKDFVVKMLQYLFTGLKFAVLALLWFVIVPVLIGIAFEMTFIIPLLVPVNKTPILFLSETWALGVFGLGLYIRIVFLLNIQPLKQELERVRL